jgi:hypothetical protein
MRLMHYRKDGTEGDITNLIQRYVWSGDFREAARKLEVEVTVSVTDSNLPAVTIDAADLLVLYGDDDSELFQGYVFKKSKDRSGNSLSLRAYDGMIYLIKSEFSKLFLHVTAEQVASAACSELGVPAGVFATTGIPQSFPHLRKTGYEAIMTAYTTAGRQNGKRYMPRMNAGKLDVIEKGSIVAKRLVLAAEHILDSSYSEDIENMVNAVVITDDRGNRYGTISNPEWVHTYGLLQKVYQKEQGKDAVTIAKSLLQDLNREATMELVGGPDAFDLIAGNAVHIEEPYTGLMGVFWIDEDTHTFENGQYKVSLTLNFKNVMDEQEADEFEKETGSSSFSLTLNEYG